MRWFTVAVIVCGCAFKQYSPPLSLPAADAQKTFAQAVEHLVKNLKTEPLKGHIVYVKFRERKDLQFARAKLMEEMTAGITLPLLGIYSHQPVLRTRPPQEEDYVASLILCELARRGVCLTQNPDAADITVFVILLASGAETTIRELSYQGIVLYYSEQMRREVRLLVAAYNHITGKMFNLLRGKSFAEETTIFLLKITGPVLRNVGGTR